MELHAGDRAARSIGKELGDYYARLVSWYAQGGFTDEAGRRHESGYHYAIPIWEVLNEVEAEHSTTPEDYTVRYDAIVSAIRQVSPQTRFMGLALAAPRDNPRFFEYFLNPANHKPGIPLDYISFHFYATPQADAGHPTAGSTHSSTRPTGSSMAVRYIETIRKRLSPRNEDGYRRAGSHLCRRPSQNDPGHVTRPIAQPTGTWPARSTRTSSSSCRACRSTSSGNRNWWDIRRSFPSVSMMDWETQPAERAVLGAEAR